MALNQAKEEWVGYSYPLTSLALAFKLQN